MTDNQLTSYLKRDTGTTSGSDYPYWNDVLEHDYSARIWNRMTHSFRHEAQTPKRRDWLAAHYSLLIDLRCSGHDRQLLGKKLLAHITQGSEL